MVQWVLSERDHALLYLLQDVLSTDTWRDQYWLRAHLTECIYQSVLGSHLAHKIVNLVLPIFN